MYYFININGQQQGPVSIDQLISNGINSETLVWKAGMAQWTKAKLVPELTQLFLAPPIPPTRSQSTTGRPVGTSNIQQPTPQPTPTHSSAQQQTNIPKPDNYMIWAALSTVCCCVPMGAYAIYCASQVDTLYNKGNYAEAKSFAEKAKSWAIISAVSGGIVSIVSGIIMALSGL